MILTDLPTELLMALPQYMHNIEDFNNASSTCRKLRHVFAATTPNTILRLAYKSAPTFFHPHPWFLVAMTARQVGEWSLKSDNNLKILLQAFRGGIDGLLELCIDRAGITMDDIRRWHLARYRVINPIADLIDCSAGTQWYSQPNFWNGGASDAFTIHCEPMRATFQIMIYGELFASSMEAAIYPEKKLPKHDIETRLDYVRYCIPDWVCPGAYYGLTPPEEVGPYAPGNENYDADQTAIDHILQCRRWKQALEPVRRQGGSDFDEEWRQTMWENVVQVQGLDSLRMMRCGGGGPQFDQKWRVQMQSEILEDKTISAHPETFVQSDTNDYLAVWKDKLLEWRDAISKIEDKDKPKETFFGRNPLWDYPSMWRDTAVLMQGLWPQWRGPTPVDDD